MSKTRTTHTLGMFLLSCLISTSGCGSSGTETVPVTGKVTCKGQPVVKASVVFMPVTSTGGGRPATGETDANGMYSLSTFEVNDGAVPGEHRVSIVIVSDEPEPPPGAKEARFWKPPLQPFADKYTQPETSGLTATVERGKENSLDFDLAPK
jgi:hypothetical protein